MLTLPLSRLSELGLHKPLFLHSPFNPPPAHFVEAIAQIPKARVESISSVGTLDILLSHDIVADKQALEWLISSVRNHHQMRVADVYSGNAMVMRRRSLGLTDFPAEGEQDESKQMLAELEAQVATAQGGPGGFEIWRGKAVENAQKAQIAAAEEERKRIIAAGTKAKEEWQMLVGEGLIDLVKPRAVQEMEEMLANEQEDEFELTDAQSDQIEQEADRLVGALKE